MARRDEERFWVLAARREERPGCGEDRVRVPFCLPCMFLLHATTLSDGKDGSPMGVVRRGGMHIVCSTEAQWN